MSLMSHLFGSTLSSTGHLSMLVKHLILGELRAVPVFSGFGCTDENQSLHTGHFYTIHLRGMYAHGQDSHHAYGKLDSVWECRR